MSLSCLHCQARTQGVVLCARCKQTASTALEHLATHHAALFSLGTPVQVRRRSGRADPTGNAVGRPRPEAAVIEDTAAATTTMLVTWTRALCDDRGLEPPGKAVSRVTAFLRRHLSSIATLEWAGEFVRELLEYERTLQRLVSRNQGHWYAGICGASTGSGPDDWCPNDLFVQPGMNRARCHGCGASWSVEQRRSLVIEQARETLLPVSVIARAAVSLLGEETSQQKLEARLRKWIQRGQLEDYGVRVLVSGQQPRRVYRLGEVMDRLAREARSASTTA